MRILKSLIAGLIFVAVAVVSLGARQPPDDLGRATLAPSDRWASFGDGTVGGSAATPDQVDTVTTRAELVAALNNGVYPAPSSTPSNTPKIIYVRGTIDANVDDDNQPLSCADDARNGFTIDAFLAAYDPATWGRVTPTGPMEAARLASQAAQQARVRIRVGYVGWTPALFLEIAPARHVLPLVLGHSGPFAGGPR